MCEIFREILPVPYNIVIDLNNVMKRCTLKQGTVVGPPFWILFDNKVHLQTLISGYLDIH
jgi:hypothetical protein